jgi:crotonobetainyl-CoA:carnitine CoA-transferase CaiB-like acyl-CoA transferase
MGREMVTEIEHPMVGMVKMLGLPIKFDGTPGSIRRHPPMLGEHTDEVLTELAELSPDEIADLRSRGVV